MNLFRVLLVVVVCLFVLGAGIIINICFHKLDTISVIYGISSVIIAYAIEYLYNSINSE